MTAAADLRSLQHKIWEGCVPLEIRLADAQCKTYEQSEPYLLLCPRLSYLPFHLQKLHEFFRELLIDDETNWWDGWFSFENVPLKWQFPVGLLFDLYSGNSDLLQDENGHGGKKGTATTTDAEEHSSAREWPRTWQIVIHFGEWPVEALARLDEAGKVMEDSFQNNYKEAAFVRYGSSKPVFSLNMEDTRQLWRAVETTDFPLFSPVYQKLMYQRGAKSNHIPLKIYLPTVASDDDEETTTPGHLRIIQALITAQVSSRPQTLGTALNSMVPSLFPSRRSPLLAQPVLHGAIVPLGMNLETLSQIGAYADGFLHIAVSMMI